VFVPVADPLSSHWYEGVPPFVGVAVNTTLEPLQMFVADALTETAGVSEELTVIVTLFDAAEAGEAQASEDVITHETMSPFARDALVYVGLFVPTSDPFSFH